MSLQSTLEKEQTYLMQAITRSNHSHNQNAA